MEEKRKPLPWSYGMVVGLILLVAYPLSMGPACWWTREGYATQTHTAQRAMQIVYWPLFRSLKSEHQFSDWMNWYLDFWM